MSTSRDTQYIGGYHDACEGYHEYIRDVQYIRVDIMSISGDV